MVAPEISGVPLRSSEIKQLNKNHRTVVFTVSVILPFEVLIRLIYNVFHSLASSANLRRICIFACQFTLFVIWQARQMWIQLAKCRLQVVPIFNRSLTQQAGQVYIHSRKTRLQIRSRFHRSLSLQAGRVGTHFCKNLIFKLCRFTIRS